MKDPEASAAWIPADRLALIVILACAILPRLLLSLVNQEANDDHLLVSRMIIETGVLPLAGDCWQCYQPKLFHQIVAFAIQTLGVERLAGQIVLAQLLNFFASVLTLLVLWRMTSFFPVRPAIRLIAFALVALNPRVNGISAQATNDSFVILFGSLVVYALWRYLDEGRSRWLVGLVLALVLMALSKTQGLVFVAMLVVVLGIKSAASFGDAAGRRRFALAATVVLVVASATIPFLGPYYQQAQKLGDPFAANWERMPAPAWLEESLYRRPGVRSIVDGYATFRLVDMLRQPYIKQGWCRGGRRHAYQEELGPVALTDPMGEAAGDGQFYDTRCSEHRTSLWSQLYGRTQSLRFSNNLRSWRMRDPALMTLGRALLVAGLLPLAVLLLGVVLEARDLLGGLVRDGPRWLARDHRWILLAIFGGSVAVVVRLNYLMRDFSSMKPIYLFPALACVVVIYMRGLTALVDRLDGRGGWVATLYVAHGVLFGLYVLDVGWLVADLL